MKIFANKYCICKQILFQFKYARFKLSLMASSRKTQQANMFICDGILFANMCGPRETSLTNRVWKKTKWCWEDTFTGYGWAHLKKGETQTQTTDNTVSYKAFGLTFEIKREFDLIILPKWIFWEELSGWNEKGIMTSCFWLNPESEKTCRQGHQPAQEIWYSWDETCLMSLSSPGLLPTVIK